MQSTRSAIMERLKAAEALMARLQDNKIDRFSWTPKQWEAMTTEYRLTMIAGANQYSGKTTCNTARQARHLNNDYPRDWGGRRWTHPIKVCATSKTLDKLRDTVIDKMFGKREELGSGWIQARCIDEKKIEWSKKAKDAIEYAKLRWFDDTGTDQGWSEFYGFSFDQKWDRVSGYSLHDILISEECKLDFHRELWNRTNVTGGQLVMDMIPMLGETELYTSYERDTTGVRKLITITIDDCLHLSEEDRETAKREKAGDPWEEAVLYGRPVRGQGRVFTSPEQHVMMAPFSEGDGWPPLYFLTLIGIDIPHSTGAFAAVRILYDPEKDIVYVVDCTKVYDTPREVHAERMKSMGATWIPVAWPHDTGRKETGGVAAGPISQRYRNLGVKMLGEPAYMVGFDGKKTNATMTWIEEVRDRERSGRIFYAPTVRELLDERCNFHHEKGAIVDGQEDHCLDALGKAILALRWAIPVRTILEQGHPYFGKRRKKQRQQVDVDFFSL